MKWLFLLAYSAPAVYLAYKLPDRFSVVGSFLIASAILYLGWKIIRLPGCLRFLGVVIFLAGAYLYYLMLLQPLWTGQLVDLNHLY